MMKPTVPTNITITLTFPESMLARNVGSKHGEFEVDPCEEK